LSVNFPICNDLNSQLPYATIKFSSKEKFFLNNNLVIEFEPILFGGIPFSQIPLSRVALSRVALSRSHLAASQVAASPRRNISRFWTPFQAL
jgi:hypothetical protein